MRSKIEFRMLSVLLRQLLNKVSLLEVDVLCCMPAVCWKP